MTLDDVRASLVQLGCPASARGTADSYSIGIPFPLSNFSFFIQEARTWTRVWKGATRQFLKNQDMILQGYT